MNDDSFDINTQVKQLPSTLSKVIYWLLLLPGSGAISGLIAIIVTAIGGSNIYTAFAVLIYVFPIILLLSAFGFFILKNQQTNYHRKHNGSTIDHFTPHSRTRTHIAFEKIIHNRTRAP